MKKIAIVLTTIFLCGLRVVDKQSSCSKAPISVKNIKNFEELSKEVNEKNLCWSSERFESNENFDMKLEFEDGISINYTIKDQKIIKKECSINSGKINCDSSNLQSAILLNKANQLAR